MNKSILEKQIKDWKIKHDNLSVAKKISEEDLNRRIDGLQKELAIRDKKIDYLYDIIGKLTQKVNVLSVQVAELTKENTKLKEIIAIQNDQINKLKSRIDKDSSNSNKPSSTDGFRKPIQNNREKTDKKVGGQPGHKGHSLNQFAYPTEIIDKKVSVCDRCNGEVLNGTDYVAKQLIDIEVNLVVIEERAYSGVCVKCGRKHTGIFSDECKNPVQYGDNIKALITILNDHGYVSINKTSDILRSLTGNRLNISGGTIVNILNSLSGKIGKTLGSIRENLIKGRVLNADETGCRVDAKINWVQVFSNKSFTLYGYNDKRGSVSIEGMEILDYFIGILVHDHFSAYYKNSLAIHAECNAHILRYLKGIMEIFKHEWAGGMIELLVDSLRRKKACIQSGNSSFTPEEIGDIRERYGQILEKGRQEYEDAIRGKERIQYYNDEKLLLKRLQEFKDEHMLFITNFDAPFDNNQAERDLRGIKTKAKVSGCFRSSDGIDSFTKIFSLVSTLRKQNMDILASIRDIFGGKVLTFT